MEAREREFDKLKERLEELRLTLRGRLGRINTHLRRAEGDEAIEYEELAQKAENDEVLEHLDLQGNAELERVELALQRMGAGTYGECVNCGGDIQIARLKAIPWATMCVECAREREEQAPA